MRFVMLYVGQTVERGRVMKVALTGAATGIGAAVAAKLKAQGAHITAFDIQEPAQNTDVWIKADLNDLDAIAGVVGGVDGPFDALINNAGLPPRAGLEDTILRVNYFGLSAFLDAALDKLAEGASIVNTASRAGAQWRENLDQVKALMALDPGHLPGFIKDHAINPARAYNLSKEAVIVMTMARAAVVQQLGFRMNSVSPAAVSTGILDDFAVAFGDMMTKNVARSGRPGAPDEIADVIAFLASPESRWIKGQDIVIDGGMTAIATSEALGL